MTGLVFLNWEISRTLPILPKNAKPINLAESWWFCYFYVWNYCRLQSNVDKLHITGRATEASALYEFEWWHLISTLLCLHCMTQYNHPGARVLWIFLDQSILVRFFKSLCTNDMEMSQIEIWKLGMKALNHCVNGAYGEVAFIASLNNFCRWSVDTSPFSSMKLSPDEACPAALWTMCCIVLCFWILMWKASPKPSQTLRWDQEWSGKGL